MLKSQIVEILTFFPAIINLGAEKMWIWRNLDELKIF